MKRGDVVIVDFPYSDRSGSKVRPALVVQSDDLNRSRADTVLAIISSSSSGRATTEFLVDIAKEPGIKLSRRWCKELRIPPLARTALCREIPENRSSFSYPTSISPFTSNGIAFAS